jgi:hypothetical protein
MRVPLAVLALFFVAHTAAAQVPAGPEILVNTYTPDGQLFPALAHQPDGGFVVVWHASNQEGGYGLDGIFGQRFGADGAARGAEFHVNTYTTLRQQDAAIAADARGSFVVVWHSEGGQDGDEFGVFGQRFDRAGQPIGAEFLVNGYTSGAQFTASVARVPDGSFVVAWEGIGQGGSAGDIFGQRFDPLGARRGAEFLVNVYTTGLEAGASVSADAAGRFTVAWNDYGQDGSAYGVSARRFDASGAPLTGDFRVNTYTSFSQYQVASAGAPGGEFVVVWTGDQQDGDRRGVFGQRFDRSGNRAGGEFQVNVYTEGDQVRPSVAMDSAGNFVVAWTSSANQDGDSYGVFARRFDTEGAPRGAEFQVNTYTPYFQYQAAVSTDAVGNFVVAWGGFARDGSSYMDVFAQRFGGLRPAAMAVDTAGNRVLEPGESVDVRPSWRNVNGAAQTFASSAVAITGPSGATYAITDGVADYGAVPDGATAECTDCLGVSISDPPTRPAMHWDATLVERITPDAQGQHMPWRLHVARSFTDVPPSSGFYRFVETLLHHGIAGGCTATAYCPGNPATREQMAVFVLVAKEGAGYLPEPCATPVFADVPAASPFCRWIEELARRGVVSGCGGGNYCPTAAVTREQMAVFVLRTLEPALDPPACTTPVFADVPASSPFCRWIEELARRGLVSGCGGGNYCPADPVTREQMSAFISMTFGLTLYGP